MSLPCEAAQPLLRALFPLAEAPNRLPRRRGRKVHKSAPYRWQSAGIAGVRLQAVLVGGELHTSEQWLLEFFRAVTAAKARGVV